LILDNVDSLEKMSASSEAPLSFKKGNTSLLDNGPLQNEANLSLNENQNKPTQDHLILDDEDNRFIFSEDQQHDRLILDDETEKQGFLPQQQEKQPTKNERNNSFKLDDEPDFNTFILDDEGEYNAPRLDDTEDNALHSDQVKQEKIEEKAAFGDLEEPKQGKSLLYQLLDTAKQWSEAGGQSRVIIITRSPYSKHGSFGKTGLKHCQLLLDHLEEKEALRYFETLMTLPPQSAHAMPKRAEVEQLFEKISYHPLSIRILAFQLKQNSIKNLSEYLDRLLRELPADKSQYEKSLLASLNLFWDKLDRQLQPYLLRLALFRGGAFENILQAITPIPDALWQKLRQILEASGLIQLENIEGVTLPYFKFHPSLTALLETRLPSIERDALIDRYCQGYYEFANFLYDEDNKNPCQTRMIERKELPNLLQAVHFAIEKQKDWALQLANNVKLFLIDFGLKTDRDELKVRPPKRLTQTPDWFIANSHQAEQLYGEGQYQEAYAIFQKILEQLGEHVNYDRCVTLGWLGRCQAEKGELHDGIDCFRQALQELEELNPSPQTKQETGYIQTYLATVLKEIGDYKGAITAYETALPIMKAIGNLQSEARIQDQLGTLALLQHHLPKAERQHREALRLFQQLNQPQSEAKIWYHLGAVYQTAEQWKPAAQAYQKAANLSTEQGDLALSTVSWLQFASIAQAIGHLTEAEKAYRQAIESGKTVENGPTVSTAFRNLADMLSDQLQRLDEAQQLAEAGLAIDKTLDPNEAEIWETYQVLAKIAERQNKTEQAKTYHRLARETKTTSTDVQNELRQHQRFIDAVVQTITHPKLRTQLESMLQQRENKGWNKLVITIRRIIEGERDYDNLCQREGLDLTDAMIVHRIIQQIENLDHFSYGSDDEDRQPYAEFSL